MTAFSDSFSTSAFDAGEVVPTGVGSGALSLAGGAESATVSDGDGAGKIELGGYGLTTVPEADGSGELLLGGSGFIKTTADFRYDAYWDNCVLALRFNGEPGSYTHDDDKGHLITDDGSGGLSSSEFESGNTSVKFVGIGNVQCEVDPNVTSFGTGDFTIALSFNSPYTELNEMLVWAIDGAEGFSIRRSFNYVQFASADGVVILTGNDLPPDQWLKLMVTRQGDTVRLFIDGVLKSSFNAVGRSIGSATAAFAIGSNYTYGSAYNGYVDELYVVRGVALETADYAPIQFFDLPPTGNGVGGIALQGDAIGGAFVNIEADGAGEFVLSGSSTGEITPTGIGFGSISTGGDGVGLQAIAGSAAGELALSGASNGAAFSVISGEAIGAVPMDGGGVVRYGPGGYGSGVIDLLGAGAGAHVVVTASIGSGLIYLHGGGSGYPIGTVPEVDVDDCIFVMQKHSQAVIYG